MPWVADKTTSLPFLGRGALRGRYSRIQCEFRDRWSRKVFLKVQSLVMATPRRDHWWNHFFPSRFASTSYNHRKVARHPMRRVIDHSRTLDECLVLWQVRVIKRSQLEWTGHFVRYSVVTAGLCKSRCLWYSLVNYNYNTCIENDLTKGTEEAPEDPVLKRFPFFLASCVCFSFLHCESLSGYR